LDFDNNNDIINLNINTIGQKCHVKGSRKENKTHRETTNVEHEMYDYTGNNGSHRNGNKRFKEKPYHGNFQ
jgi:hypothetical protein